ncbi:MAG: NAD(P)/FAD-dependent oxidoreductase [Salinisphaera sp.]|nr:NAD(P)/FAD-dependent oxidoreductase [Salinisphaera sp.]
METRKHQVVIVGGGAGGLSVASCLLKRKSELDIAIVEPSEYHYYQPAWTLVGGGTYSAEATRRQESRYIPGRAKWIQQQAASFEPDQNAVVLADGTRVEYEFLVVAAGIQLDWHKIEGLEETLGQNGVSSNYRYDLAPYTWECISRLDGGTALFTQPVMPIKCAGAPQKIMYLAADHFRSRGIHVDVRFCPAGPSMFGVPAYSKALAKVVEAYGATADYNHNLVAVDGPGKKATFEVGENKERVEKPFHMIHVVPPQSAPDFIKNSPLANEGGWVAVDKASLRHDQYANVFGLGDCTSTPNSKTAAAVRSQAPVLADNLAAAVDGKPPTAAYDGYAACPVTTSRGKVMLCEFSYDGVITPSFPFDPRKPRRFYWWLKKSFFPGLYWRMLGGNMGPYRSAPRELSDSLPRIVP